MINKIRMEIYVRVQYIAYCIKFDLFVDMSEEG